MESLSQSLIPPHVLDFSLPVSLLAATLFREHSSLTVQGRKQKSKDHHNPPTSNINMFHSIHLKGQLAIEYEQELNLVRELLNIKRSFGDTSSMAVSLIKAE